MKELTKGSVINACVTTAGLVNGMLANLDKQETKTLMSKVEGWIEFNHFVAELGIKAEKMHVIGFLKNKRNEPGVWLYEVAEPLGEQLAKHVLNGGDYEAFEWQPALRALNNAFYKKPEQADIAC